MKRMLMLASVASMIDQFNMPNIELLQEMGYEVHVACNFEKGSTCTDEKVLELKKKLKQLHVRFFQIDFERNVMKLNQDLKAYKQVLKLVRKYHYTFIHCHSPIGGVVGRLVGHKTNTKVIYTAHGFHFYEGAPLLNWLIYYPIEKLLSRFTDVLITINQEDYHRAKSKFHAKRVEYVPGVGIDIKRFQNVKVDILQKRKELGIRSKDIVLLSVGELNKNKNHEIVIKALSGLDRPDVKYLLVGQGELKNYLKNLARKLEVEDQVKFLGFRSDVAEIYKIADAFIFPSKREGLGLAAIEAMASGLPLITSNIHGIKDYSKENITGFLCDANDWKTWKVKIEKILKEEKARKEFGKNNIEIASQYDVKKISSIMHKIYFSVNAEEISND
ncbi:glycosyltransferase family 4 protein [Sellimonas catena]|uniref:Glycosyl transferase family 1 n=1 Tax=Sellimonas catena TaxID=2994035 RepID=A0A9W6CAY3_9FIRM|nr:glycosyltransferase family 4 protein [Sellimonas catena]GLG06328.1 glycosyl transferase family 1 [Sellimonas catena]